MEALRKYDGWWYFADLKLPDRDPRPTAYTTVGTPRTSTEDLVSSVVWNAFRTCDSDRLEAALTNASLRDEPDSLVVHEQTGQRIAKVSFSTMTIEAIYWAMPSSPVRRAIWMQMKSSDYAAGGAPVPVEWEEILEEAYDQYTIWIASASSSDGVVEKMVSLWGALVSYVLILRRGVPDAARMVLAKALESSPPMGFSKKETIRLVRGYIPYYIAVTAAVKQVDGSAGRSSPSPMPAVLPSPFEAVDTSPGVAPKALLLAVHGIGQKLAGRYGHHFIRDCIKLKECILPAMTNKGGSANDLIVIPITWRRSVKMSTKYFAEYDGPEGGRLSGSPEISFEDLVASITLGNIPAIRNIASDVGLDILLYMTPIYFKRIIKATLAEVRRIYVLFRKFGGVGAAKTKVSFVGHSLGCAIISDLLSFVAEDLHKATVREKSRAVLSNLGFAVDKFFAMGSPLAIFFLLKHLKPVACFTDVPDLQEGESSEGRVRDAYPSLPEASAMDILEPRAVIFACREIYNIFNPNDPIAYRMEPLIVSPIEMKRYSYPVRLPSHKRGLKQQMEDSMNRLHIGAQRARDDIVRSIKKSLPEWMGGAISATPFKSNGSITASSDGALAGGSGGAVEASSRDARGHVAVSVIEDKDALIEKGDLFSFNRHGRVDFCLEESLFENPYLSAIGAHFSYWYDMDIASFMGLEALSISSNTIRKSSSD